MTLLVNIFLKNTPTFFAMSYFSLYLDYFYPKGGTIQLPLSLEQKIYKYNGEIKKNTEINYINVVDKYVQDLSGDKYFYKELLWASDLKSLYKFSDTKGLSKKENKKIKIKEELIMNSKGSDSVFTLFLEVDVPFCEFAKISNGHFFYTPSKEGLGETNKEKLKELLSQKVNKEKINQWLSTFIKLNTFEISIPSLKIKSASPEGQTGLIVSLLFPYEIMHKVEKDGWYDEFKINIENEIISVLSNSVLPILKNKILKQFSYTPVSIRKRINSSQGSIIGWSFEQSVPAIHKMQQVSKSVITPFPNISQAGQWAYSPSGVPMAILTGKLASDKIIKGLNK